MILDVLMFMLVHQIERHSSLLSGSRIAALEQTMCCSSGLQLQLQGLNNDISRAAIKPAQEKQQQKDVFAFAGAAAVSIDAVLDC